MEPQEWALRRGYHLLSRCESIEHCKNYIEILPNGAERSEFLKRL